MQKIFNKDIIRCLEIILLLNSFCSQSVFADHRGYQHGIDILLMPDNRILIIWASSGNPPIGKSSNGNWSHDVYYSFFNSTNSELSPRVLFRNIEAQEPASAAISKNGNVLITVEDGWNAKNEIAQRFGLYDSELTAVKGYPQNIEDGGHSGHVASVGSKFVVFYSTGWVNGGGVDNLGSGDDVKVKVYTSSGELLMNKDIAVGEKRDWWPLVAGSSTKAFLVWQRFVENKTYADLMYAVLDITSGELLKSEIPLTTKVEYYTYNVEYIQAINNFLITGTSVNGKGFAYLIDEEGDLKEEIKSLPPMIRESQLIVKNNAKDALVLQPKAPSGIMLLKVTDSEVTLVCTIEDEHIWGKIGTDGIFLSDRTVLLASLSSSGLILKRFNICQNMNL